MQVPPVEHRDSPRARLHEPPPRRQPLRRRRLVRHQRRTPDVAGDEDDRAAYRVPNHPALPLVVAVEVQLVTGAVRSAVRPPLRRRRFPRSRKSGGGDAPHATHDGVHGAPQRMRVADVIRVPRRQPVRVAEETASGFVVPVLRPKAALRAENGSQVRQRRRRHRAVEGPHVLPVRRHRRLARARAPRHLRAVVEVVAEHLLGEPVPIFHRTQLFNRVVVAMIALAQEHAQIVPGGPSRRRRDGGDLPRSILRVLEVEVPGFRRFRRRAEEPLGVVEVRLVPGSNASKASGVEQRRRGRPLEPAGSSPARAFLGERASVLA